METEEKGQYEDGDEEADKIYAAIDEKLKGRHSKRKREAEQDKGGSKVRGGKARQQRSMYNTQNYNITNKLPPSSPPLRRYLTSSRT